MEFLTALLASIIRPIIQEEIAKLKDWVATQMGIKVGVEKIGVEAKGLMEELDNASSPTEIKAILRKLDKFSDLSKLIPGGLPVSAPTAEGHKMPD